MILLRGIRKDVGHMAFKNLEDKTLVNIKVIGVGGGGNNAVDNMIQSEVHDVEFIAVNTDKQQLEKRCLAPEKVVIGEKITRGFGAGADPEVGRKAAEESRDAITAAIKGSDMVFITAGMGGGTGTGAAPLVAQIAKELGILTVGIVTKPFAFEGQTKIKRAEAGIDALLNQVDTLVVIPNENLKLVSESKVTMLNAFKVADTVLKEGVESITTLIQSQGIINLDFNDVTAILKDAGYAHWSVQTAKGKDKAEMVAKAVIQSPLLESSIKGAKGVILYFNADTDVTMEDIELAAQIIRESAAPDANIIWGVNLDESLEDELQVTVIATHFDDEGKTLIMPKDFEIPSSSDSVSEITEKEEVKSSSDISTSVVSEDDEDDDFLKLLNDITKSK